MVDKKQLQEIKEANKKIVEGSLTIWNARLDILVNAGREKDLVNYLGNASANPCPANVVGCDPNDPTPWPEDADPNTTNCPWPDPPPEEVSRRLDKRLNEMAGRINIISRDISEIKKRFNNDQV